MQNRKLEQDLYLAKAHIPHQEMRLSINAKVSFTEFHSLLHQDLACIAPSATQPAHIRVVKRLGRDSSSNPFPEILDFNSITLDHSAR